MFSLFASVPPQYSFFLDIKGKSVLPYKGILALCQIKSQQRKPGLVKAIQKSALGQTSILDIIRFAEKFQ